MKQLRPRKTKKIKVIFKYVPVDMKYHPTFRGFICDTPIFI